MSSDDINCETSTISKQNIKPEGIPWEPIYSSIRSDRLWPTDPTIDKFNTQLWKQEGVKIVLDAGCGDGKNLAWLLAQGFFGVGVDASDSALEKCEEYLDHQGFKNCYILLKPSSLETLPFNQGGLSGAICIDVLGHNQQPEGILAELARIIKPGGLLYISLFHPADSCRLGPRMREGEKTGEYWYTPSLPNRANPKLEYYYRFYTKSAIQHLLQPLPLEILSLEQREWTEPPHEVYREEEHVHVSWFVLLRRT
jgi:SAM-dependent methyltransferase